MLLTFIIVYLVLAVGLLPPLAGLSSPAVMTGAGPVSSLLTTLPMTPTALATALQGAVSAVPSLLTDAGAVDTLTVYLTPRMAELEMTERSSPSLLTDTDPALTSPVVPTVQAADTHSTVGTSPVLLAPDTTGLGADLALKLHSAKWTVSGSNWETLRD